MLEETTNKVLIQYHTDNDYEYYSLINITLTDGKMHENCMIHTFRYHQDGKLSFLKNDLFPYLKKYYDPLQKSNQFLLVNDEIFESNFMYKNSDDRLSKMSKYIGKEVNPEDFAMLNDAMYEDLLSNVGVSQYNDYFESIKNGIFEKYIRLKDDNFIDDKYIMPFYIKKIKKLENKEWYIPKIKKQADNKKDVVELGFYNIYINDKEYLVFIKQFSDGHRTAGLNRMKRNPINFDFYKSIRQEMLNLTINETIIKTNIPNELNKIIQLEKFKNVVVDEFNDDAFINKIESKIEKNRENNKTQDSEANLTRIKNNIEANKYNLDKSIHFMFFKRDNDIYMLKKWKMDDTFYSEWKFINTKVDEECLKRNIKGYMSLVKKAKDKRNLFISVDGCPEIYEMLNNLDLKIKNIPNIRIENIELDKCQLNGYSQIRRELYDETIKMKIFKRNLGKYVANDSDSEINSLLVYTDASVIKEDDNIKLGYGMVIKTLGSDDYLYQASKKIETDIPITTSSQAEAFAVLGTISFLKSMIIQRKLDKHQRFEIRSDELFNIGLLNGEKEPEEIKDDITKDIISKIKKQVNGLNFVFRWVKGHSEDKANELADKLAYEASSGESYALKNKAKMKY